MMQIIRAKAPLRISFAGGGTDVSPYPEERGGAALNAAISKYAYATIIPSDNGKIEVQSQDYGTVVEYAMDQEFAFDGKLKLVEGVIHHFKASLPHGIKLYVHSDAPPGSGVGTSSTLVATAIGAFKEWLRLPLSSYEIAQLAYQIERIEMGQKGGRQDQYAATFGGFNFMEFYAEKTIVNPLNIPWETINELQYRLLLCYIGGSRFSSHIIERQMQCYEERVPESLEAMDGLKRMAFEMKNALLLGELEDFGKLLHEAWEYKKRMADVITNPRIDQLYNAARAAGALGGKISGAGGGGYMYFFCGFDKKPQVAKVLNELDCQLVNFDFEAGGLQSWRTTVDG